MNKISKSDVQAAVSAILKKEQSEPVSSHSSLDSQLWDLRRDFRKRLEPILTKGGFDAAQLNKALTQHHDDATRLLEKQKAQTDKDFAAKLHQSREGNETRRRAYELIGGKPLTITPIMVNTPFSTFAYPSGILDDSHIEAWNSWVKFLHGDNVDTASKTVWVSFFFAWKNDSDYYAIINAKTDLISQGRCTARAVPGTLFGGAVSLTLSASLTVHMGTTTINYYGSQSSGVAQAYASTWGDIFGGDSETKVVNVNTTSSVSCPNIVVRDGDLVIFQVTLSANYWIDNGSVLLDFTNDYHVNCPVLVVELLTAPTFTGDLSAVNPVIHP
jgi:hypothetical protein